MTHSIHDCVFYRGEQESWAFKSKTKRQVDEKAICEGVIELIEGGAV